MKETFSKRKIGKRLVSVAMLSLAVAPIATPAVQVFAEDVAVVTTDSGATATDEKSSPDTDAATDNSDAEKTAEMVARLENPRYGTGLHFLYTREYKANPELEAGSENVKVKGYPTTMILGELDGEQTGISYRPQNEIVEVGTKPKETVLEETPFKTVRRETTDLPEGEERVVQEGVNSKTVEVETYTVKPNEVDWTNAQNAKSLMFVKLDSTNSLDYFGVRDEATDNYKLNESKTGLEIGDTFTLDPSEWELNGGEVYHEDQITYDAYTYRFLPKSKDGEAFASDRDREIYKANVSILVNKQVSTNPFEVSLSDTQGEMYYPYVHSYSGNLIRTPDNQFGGALIGADFGYTLESSKETKTIEGQDEIIEVGVAKKDFDDSKPVLPEQPSETEEEVKEEAQKSVKTFWVDEDGKEIKASFVGDPQPAGDIEFYEFVETTTAENGDLTHHFKKVEKEETPATEEEVKEEETPVTEEEVKEEETPTVEEDVKEEETPATEEVTEETQTVEEETPVETETVEEETPAETEEVTEETQTVEEEEPQEETPTAEDETPATTEEAPQEETKDFSNKQPVQPEQPTQAAPAQPAQQAAPQQSQPLPATGDDSNSAIALTFAGFTASILGLFGLAKQKKVD